MGNLEAHIMERGAGLRVGLRAGVHVWYLEQQSGATETRGIGALRPLDSSESESSLVLVNLEHMNTEGGARGRQREPDASSAGAALAWLGRISILHVHTLTSVFPCVACAWCLAHIGFQQPA